MAFARNIGAVALLLLLSVLSFAEARPQTRSNGDANVTATCQTLYNAYPDLTHFSDTTEYTTINECMHLPSPTRCRAVTAGLRDTQWNRPTRY